jgi:hypothetical protein
MFSIGDKQEATVSMVATLEIEMLTQMGEHFSLFHQGMFNGRIKLDGNATRQNPCDLSILSTGTEVKGNRMKKKSPVTEAK